MSFNTRTTITGTGQTLIGYAKRNRHQPVWSGTIWAVGTFGGTTLTYQSSPDSGTTKVDLKDQTGSARSSTANDTFNIQLNTGSSNTDQIPIYVTATGGAGINITVYVFDNAQ